MVVAWLQVDSHHEAISAQTWQTPRSAPSNHASTLGHLPYDLECSSWPKVSPQRRLTALEGRNKVGPHGGWSSWWLVQWWLPLMHASPASFALYQSLSIRIFSLKETFPEEIFRLLYQCYNCYARVKKTSWVRSPRSGDPRNWCCSGLAALFTTRFRWAREGRISPQKILDVSLKKMAQTAKNSQRRCRVICSWGRSLNALMSLWALKTVNWSTQNYVSLSEVTRFVYLSSCHPVALFWLLHGT